MAFDLQDVRRLDVDLGTGARLPYWNAGEVVEVWNGAEFLGQYLALEVQKGANGARSQQHGVRLLTEDESSLSEDARAARGLVLTPGGTR